MARVGVIGGGPAGIASAVQLAREGHEVVLFEKEELGGLVANANLVENYPGFPGGVPGPELAERLRRHLEAHPVRVVREEALWAGPGGRGFLVKTESGVWEFDALVAAPGTVPKEWGVPVPEGTPLFSEVRKLRGLGLSRVAVVGAGDAAFDYSLTLAGWGVEAFILGRSPRPRCLRLLAERVRENLRAHYLPNTRVLEVELGPRLRLLREGKELALEVDAILLAIGRRPNVGFLEPALLGEPFKLFALVGDAARGNLGQVSLAVGDGMAAALKISRELK